MNRGWRQLRAERDHLPHDHRVVDEPLPYACPSVIDDGKEFVTVWNGSLERAGRCPGLSSCALRRTADDQQQTELLLTLRRPR